MSGTLENHHKYVERFKMHKSEVPAELLRDIESPIWYREFEKTNEDVSHATRSVTVLASDIICLYQPCQTLERGGGRLAIRLIHIICNNARRRMMKIVDSSRIIYYHCNQNLNKYLNRNRTECLCITCGFPESWKKWKLHAFRIFLVIYSNRQTLLLVLNLVKKRHEISWIQIFSTSLEYVLLSFYFFFCRRVFWLRTVSVTRN